MTIRHFAALDSRGRVVAHIERRDDDPPTNNEETVAWLAQRGPAVEIVHCSAYVRRGDWLDPRGLQDAIAGDNAATRRLMRWLDARGIAHSGQVSGATLAAVCGVDSRTWRKWTGGEREMPLSASRLLSGVCRL